MKNLSTTATTGGNRPQPSTRGFSLVEVTLAVAVVAIGLLGILALFPLGMDAVRQAADSTQMMSIGQDNLAYFQQFGLNSNYYSALPSEVLSSSHGYSTNQNVDGIWYRVDAVVANTGFSTITASGINMISRVRVGVYRLTTNTVLGTGGPLGSTNYYFTEVARYVQ